MKILDRYIVKTMASYTMVVMLIWLGIYAFFNFIDEIKLIGRADYTIFSAGYYVLLDLFAVMYSHYTVVILLGSIIALGHLASTSQLVIYRSSGKSISNITFSVIKTSIAFTFIVVLIGEFIAPVTTEYAEKYRSKALGENVIATDQQGFWIRDKDLIIYVKKSFDGRLFKDATMIKLSDSNKLESVVVSDIAIFDKKNINLKKTNSYRLDYNEKTTNYLKDSSENLNIQVSFDRNLLNDLKKEPNELSSWNLYKQINFLLENNLSTDVFEIELYKRLVKPITLMAMAVFSMMFIFGSLRDSSLGKKIFFGLMLSLFFELMSRIIGVLSLRFELNHLITVFIPSIVALIFALILLQRKSAH